MAEMKVSPSTDRPFGCFCNTKLRSWGPPRFQENVLKVERPFSRGLQKGVQKISIKGGRTIVDEKDTFLIQKHFRHVANMEFYMHEFPEFHAWADASSRVGGMICMYGP